MITSTEEISVPSLRHLRVFEKVAELQGVGKAAEAVALSQPAVTQAIEKVEQQIGVNLFERRSRGTYLNEPGEILYARVRMMFSKLEEALVEFGAAGGKGVSASSLTRRMTHQQIHALAAVSSSCSFADAARKLGISPVSLHRAARELERNLGRQLFKDAHTGTVTTPAAAELARKAWLAMREIEWGIEEIQAAEGRMGGRLRVGGMPRAGGYLLGATLNDLQKYFPYAQVHADIASGSHLTKALRLGEIDLIVGMNHSSPDHGEIVHEALLTSPFVLIGRANHPLAAKSSVELADLERYQWVTPNPGAARREIFDRLFKSMSRTPFPTIEANAFLTTRMLITGSDRLTLLTRFEFEFERGVGGLQILPFPPIESGHALGVAWRANWTPTPLHRKFLDLLRLRAAQSSQALAA